MVLDSPTFLEVFHFKKDKVLEAVQQIAQNVADIWNRVNGGNSEARTRQIIDDGAGWKTYTRPNPHNKKVVLRTKLSTIVTTFAITKTMQERNDSVAIK